MPITNSHNSNSKCVFLPARSGSVTIMELPPRQPRVRHLYLGERPRPHAGLDELPVVHGRHGSARPLKDDIRKILGGNMLRVTRAALKGVHRMLPAGKKPSEIKEIP